VAEHWSTLKNKGERILVNFQDRHMFDQINQKVLAKAFIDVAGHRSILKNKGVVRILINFQDRSMFSHIIRKVLAKAIN